MKRNYLIGIVAICVVLMIGVFSQTPIAQSTIEWSGIIPHIYTGATGDEAINIAMVASTTGLAVSEESALTNTLHELIDGTHTTSGAPANGIGWKEVWTQETTASHNEDIGYIGFQVSDVTLDSEDGEFVIGTMAAGAAAATKATMGSTGIWTLTGGATLDNVTASDTLTLTETKIGLVGAATVTGTATITGDVAVDTDVFAVDVTNDVVSTNGWNVSNIVTTTDQSYSLSSSGKAGMVIQTAGEAATLHLMTDLITVPGSGGHFYIKTGDASDIVIDTEGAETIDGAATYTINGTLEAVHLVTDGTDFHIIGSYLE